MILLVLAEADTQLRGLIEKETKREIRDSDSLQELINALKCESASAFVMDQRLLESDPAAAALVWKYAGVALPVIINPAIQSAERIARETRAALERRERDRKTAHKAERAAIATEMSGPLTALLLNLTIALEDKRLGRTTRIRLDRALRISEELQRALMS